MLVREKKNNIWSYSEEAATERKAGAQHIKSNTACILCGHDLLCHLTPCLWVFWVTVVPRLPASQPGTYRGPEGVRCRFPLVLLSGGSVRSKLAYFPVFLRLGPQHRETTGSVRDGLAFKPGPFQVLGGSSQRSSLRWVFLVSRFPSEDNKKLCVTRMEKSQQVGKTAYHTSVCTESQ